MTLLFITAATLAAIGWFAFWCAQDQAADLRKERDEAEAEARDLDDRLAETTAERDQWETACRAMERSLGKWTQRALDAELGIGLLNDYADRLIAAHEDELAVRRSAKKRPAKKAASR